MADKAKEMPRTLKGFRDFLPADKAARDFLEQRVVAVFERFGFQPVETPTLEYASLIMGKYGEDADRLVYSFEDRGGRRVALPYDQTVPSARVLAQHRRDLPRYFRRYAIRNVFRAENPQRGRYREFKQCDIDIFGSRSPLSDAEIVACTYFSFAEVGFRDARVRINDRRALVEALEPFATPDVDVFSVIRSIDKLDKIDADGVVKELASKGLDEAQARRALDTVSALEPSENLAAVLGAVRALGVPDEAIEFSPMLARGLDYYTGAIFEVTVPSFASGSLAGGGRYDELIEQLGGPETPAVGIAFGFDRMVEAATQLNLLPEALGGTDVLVAIFGEDTLDASLAAAARLRAAGLRCEVYPATDKMGKQFKLADQKRIPLVVVIGPDEAAQNSATLRDMRGGEQSVVAIDELVGAVKQRLG
ncbi:MAG: histidine--tRNA ligase [bacterium]|nr:histidine--tRNA ligase [bacterium]